MKAYRNILIALMAITAAPTGTKAQLMPTGSAGAAHVVVLSMGLEPHLVASLGYAARLQGSSSMHRPYVGAGLKFPPTLLGEGNWRVHLIYSQNVNVNGPWTVQLSAYPFMARARDIAGALTGLGVELRGMPLYRGKKWTNGLDVGYQTTLLTHIRHRSVSQNTFKDRYGNNAVGSGPTDGWYGLTAHRFRFGWAGRTTFNRHTALQLQAGIYLNAQRQGVWLGFAHGQFPFYANAGLTWQLGKKL